MEKSQQIRSRIKSVSGTRKITKAMEMIASSKIRRAQTRVLETRAFTAGIEEVITDIASFSSGTVTDPLLSQPEHDGTVLVLGITADRGLCGGYNSNIIRLIEKTVKELKKASRTVKLDIIGTRGRNYFRYIGYEMERIYENLSDYPKFLDAREISKDIITRFLTRQVDRVLICYTRFKNPAEQIPSVRQLLPIPIFKNSNHVAISGEDKSLQSKIQSIGQVKIGDKSCRINPEFIYDPSYREVLGSLLPQYVYTIVYSALLESTASETGARMTAMKSASDNAEEMIKELVLMYHRARQQQITMEIAEIVSGAQALSVTAD
jgi:F-type H+-transporting ATPase subunit gamma